MVEPLQIIALISSIGGVITVVGKSIHQLSTFRSKYRNAPFVVAVLAGQLCTVQTALEQLRSWSEDSLSADPRYEELTTQVGDALESFSPLIMHLQTQLDTHDLEEKMSVDIKKRLSFLWKEGELNSYFQMLDCQVNALTLLLQAIQCKTWADQKNFMAETDSRTILRAASECSSSIVTLQRGGSIRSRKLGSTIDDKTSQSFEFDEDLLNSRVYAYQTWAQHTTTTNASHIGFPALATNLSIRTPSVLRDDHKAPSIDNLSITSDSTVAVSKAYFMDQLQYYSLIENHVLKMVDKNHISAYPIKWDLSRCGKVVKSFCSRSAILPYNLLIKAAIVWKEPLSYAHMTIMQAHKLEFLTGQTLIAALALLNESCEEHLRSTKVLTRKRWPACGEGSGFLNMELGNMRGWASEWGTTKQPVLSWQLVLTNYADLKQREYEVSPVHVP